MGFGVSVYFLLWGGTFHFRQGDMIATYDGGGGGG